MADYLEDGGGCALHGSFREHIRRRDRLIPALRDDLDRMSKMIEGCGTGDSAIAGAVRPIVPGAPDPARSSVVPHAPYEFQDIVPQDVIVVAALHDSEAPRVVSPARLPDHRSDLPVMAGGKEAAPVTLMIVEAG